MSQMIGWEFPVDNADQWHGFNDAGIEHFRGSVSGSLAREILQNSLDAAAARPVTVSFKCREVPVQEIPNVDQLRTTVSQCLVDAKAGEGKKAVDFFVTAQKSLSSKTIPVLSISEKNTRGMRGPCKHGTPYFAYVKATGQSKKEMAYPKLIWVLTALGNSRRLPSRTSGPFFFQLYFAMEVPITSMRRAKRS